MNNLNFYSLFIFFIIYAFLGWLLEVVFHIFTEKKLINRGFLHGPVCPIYGFGAVLLIIFLSHLDHNIYYLFLGGFAFATILEYITGYVLELAFDTKWWDYSNEKFNLSGYVCLRFSLLWGLVAVFTMKVLQPSIAEFVYSIPNTILETVYNIILVIFVIDASLTLNSLIEFREILRDIKVIKDEMAADIKFKDQSISKPKERIRTRLRIHHMSLLNAYPSIGNSKIQDLIRNIRNRVDD